MRDGKRAAWVELPRYTGATMIPVLALNVFWLTTAREPTVRAAEGCPPPFTRDRLPRPRWPAAKPRRVNKVLGAGVGGRLHRLRLAHLSPGQPWSEPDPGTLRPAALSSLPEVVARRDAKPRRDYVPEGGSHASVS